MISSPLGLRLESEPERSPREQLVSAARLGARGVVLDAAGDLAPHRMGETGRRDLRHTIQTVQLSLVALNLPTRRPFDTEVELDDRLMRAEKAFSLAYELGARLVLARLGAIPAEEDIPRRSVFMHACQELARRADRQGVRLGIELHDDPPALLKGLLDACASPALGASVDPIPLMTEAIDPAEAVQTLGEYVVHVYAPEVSGRSRNRARVGSIRPSSRLSTPLDWEAFLGSLEEIDYRDFLTVWPDMPQESEAAFQAVSKVVERF